MVKFPPTLTACGAVEISLPNGEDVRVPVCRPTFTPSQGKGRGHYGNKMLLDYQGEALYAELVVLRLFEDHGWHGVWLDSYGKKFRRGLVDDDDGIVSKSALVNTLPFQRFPKAFEKFGGGWDVVAWNEDTVVFLECKQQAKDAIRDTQRAWLQDRLEEGASPNDFVIVEWTH